MSKSFSAIYENGVFRPLVPVDLPDHTPVAVFASETAGTGEGIVASAGTWAEGGDALDEWLAKLQQMRRSERSVIPTAKELP